MCVHMSPGTEGVVDAKLVPVLVGKLLKEEDEIKVNLLFNVSGKSWGRPPLPPDLGFSVYITFSAGKCNLNFLFFQPNFSCSLRSF